MNEADNCEIVADGFEFIEAPRVSPQGDVWFADLTGCGVYRKRAQEPVETMLPGRQWVGGLVFDTSGQVLCSGRGGIVALDPQTGRTTPVLEEIEGEPIVAVNDIEGDGRGGLFGGTIDFVAVFETGTLPAPGKLFHLSAEGVVTVLRRDVAASNGLAASPCGKWLYHAETGRGVWRYPLADSGLPEEGTLLAEIEDCDGIAVDANGDIWVACWDSGCLLHLDAQGRRIGKRDFDPPHVVSLCFDGRDPSCLYISTGGNADHPGRGEVIACQLDVRGLTSPLTSLAMLEAGA